MSFRDASGRRIQDATFSGGMPALGSQLRDVHHGMPDPRFPLWDSSSLGSPLWDAHSGIPSLGFPFAPGFPQLQDGSLHCRTPAAGRLLQDACCRMPAPDSSFFTEIICSPISRLVSAAPATRWPCSALPTDTGVQWISALVAISTSLERRRCDLWPVWRYDGWMLGGIDKRGYYWSRSRSLRSYYCIKTLTCRLIKSDIQLTALSKT